MFVLSDTSIPSIELTLPIRLRRAAQLLYYNIVLKILFWYNMTIYEGEPTAPVIRRTCPPVSPLSCACLWCVPPSTLTCAGEPHTQKGKRMLKGKDQLFADFGHFVMTQGYGEVYQRDPRQAVPPDCGFIRFRSPGSGLFNAAGIIKFRQRDDGVKACQAFVASSDEPLELQMNFPSETPRNFASPTFAEAHADAQSRWRRWQRAVHAW